MNLLGPTIPDFPFGAVYYRVSNPPAEAWERDYRTAAEDGNNTFRHWFLWAAIEREPGVYTWDDYDRQLDLAAEHGIRTIIAEMITIAPEWTYRLHPHARLVTATGVLSSPDMHPSCATGGILMCFDNDDLLDRAAEFLTRLAERYRDHPGLGGYDIWNECNIPADSCYCDGTIAKFREWLRTRYGSVEVLRDAWWRPGLADWDDVTPPRRLQPYNDSLDWLRFRVDNAHQMMRRRADLIRRVDPAHPVTAHGLSMSLRRLAPNAADDWRAASTVGCYGLTWGSARHGDEPWKQSRAMDLVRGACRGKPFWHAEAYGGPLWYAPQVVGRPRDQGRICTPEDIRYWNLTSYMHGATGTLYLRWRPLLDGVLFGAFGPYAMDGSRTDRSRMSTDVAAWVQAPEQKPLWRSRPVAGEIGIAFNPECQLFTYAQHRTTAPFGESYEGVYRGFLDAGIQADFVHLDDIDAWRFLYLPYPVLLSDDAVERLIGWVSSGGTLISEGCPGYWSDRARIGERQPSRGLARLFGCTESYVEFTPDLLDDIEFTLLDTPARGGLLLQCYEPTTGTVVGRYTDGRAVAVTNSFGGGRTLLIGTMVGRGYGRRADSAPAGIGLAADHALFETLFGFGSSAHPYTRRSDHRIRVRVHAGEGGTFVWVANPVRHDVEVTVTISDRWRFTAARPLRGPEARGSGQSMRLLAPARDVCVYELVE